MDREAVIVGIEPDRQLPGKTYRLCDISKNGFKLETDHCLMIGEHFAFSFRLPDGSESCRLCGRVVWLERLATRPESYQMGLVFPQPLDKLPEVFSVPLTDKERARLDFSNSQK